MEQPVPIESSVKILALGDSYTKGESVVFAQNFPNQLADSLRADGQAVTQTRIIAQTGWRTDQLQIALTDAHIGDSTYDLVTLCIGVNNQYQHGNFLTFKTQFEQLLQSALSRSGDRKERVVVVSIPDWAYTPYGQHFTATPAQISQEIDQYNQASQTIAAQYGVHYVNVTDISRQGLVQPELVAGDGLHPSALQYTDWVKLLLPVVKEALSE
ncbi:MAG: SGNH/GDSL hydrolase family protein [Saprospiraceae bacterium]